MTRKRRTLALLLCTTALATPNLVPSSATATFHLMAIREIYPGSSAAPGAEYVELQMYAAGQNLVQGHSVTFYGAGGGAIGSDAFAQDAPNDQNQSTVLLGTAAAESQFGPAVDAPMTPERLDPAGGAVCFEMIDCVSWGSFGTALPSPTGQPAAPGGIPDGMALRRTIAPNCATLLEAADDRDSGALDFSAVFPKPRPNSVAPSEHACSSQGQGGTGSPGPGSARGAPQTKILRGPRRVTHDRTPTFRFTSTRAGATFLCRLDRGRFRRCHSPFTARRLSLGRHLFAVAARAPDGTLDPSPARYRFEVVNRQG